MEKEIDKYINTNRPILLNVKNSFEGFLLSAAIEKAAKAEDPTKIKPGCIFIIDFGHGHGHTGIVVSTNGGYLTTIEGNTNPELSSNGYGVFKLNRRKIKDITKGFLDYSTII